MMNALWICQTVLGILARSSFNKKDRATDWSEFTKKKGQPFMEVYRLLSWRCHCRLFPCRFTEKSNTISVTDKREQIIFPSVWLHLLLVADHQDGRLMRNVCITSMAVCHYQMYCGVLGYLTSDNLLILQEQARHLNWVSAVESFTVNIASEPS
jgi:hypothetical protein